MFQKFVVMVLSPPSQVQNPPYEITTILRGYIILYAHTSILGHRLRWQPEGMGQQLWHHEPATKRSVLEPFTENFAGDLSMRPLSQIEALASGLCAFLLQRSLWSSSCSFLFRRGRNASILEETEAFKRSYCFYFRAERNLWTLFQRRTEALESFGDH